MFLMLIGEACHVDGKTVTCFSCLLEKPVMFSEYIDMFFLSIKDACSCEDSDMFLLFIREACHRGEI